jgi:hypothetical protein
MHMIEGHAIVSADGMIADGAGEYPAALRNDADWRLYQAALDRAAVVVIGRRGHERHPNPGRRRLVLTHGVDRLADDPRDSRATLWNPAALPLREALTEIGVGAGTVAITGVFDFFVGDYDRFALSESHALLIPGGTPCFGGGHPRVVLAEAGLRPATVELIDPAAMVTTTVWADA